jgi:hypothetical protein
VTWSDLNNDAVWFWLTAALLIVFTVALLLLAMGYVG